MAYATTTLTGTYQLFDGTPASGTIEIIPSEKVVKDTTGDVILSGRVKIQLDSLGQFSVDLPATDDPTLNPTGFGYTVSAKLSHHHPPAVSFALPTGPPVDIEDVTSVDPSTFVATTTYVEAADFTALDARVTSLETTPSVTSYTDLTDKPIIPDSPDDIGAAPDQAAYHHSRAAIDRPDVGAAAFTRLLTVSIGGVWRFARAAEIRVGETIGYDVYLPTGRYQLELLTYQSGTNGKVTAAVDGVPLEEADLYNSGTALLQPAWGGLLVETAGVKRLTFKVTGKNPSSTDYTFPFGGLSIKRVGDVPTKLATTADLFLDTRQVASSTGVTFTANAPTKDAQNPLFGNASVDTWDRDKSYTTVIHKDGTYHAFYYGVDDTGSRTCYATSTDGTTFTRPSLGLVNYSGLRTLRTNHVPNPSMETNVTGWAGYNGATLARGTTVAHSGTASMQLSGMTSGAGAEWGAAGAGILVNAGETLTASAYLRSATVGRRAAVYIAWWGSSNQRLSNTTNGSVTTTTTEWTRHSVTATAPAGTVRAGILVYFLDSGAAGDVHYADSVQLEKSATLGSYFDGDTPDAGGNLYNWSGTAHASSSKEQETVGTDNNILLPHAHSSTIYDTDTGLWVMVVDKLTDGSWVYTATQPTGPFTQVKELKWDGGVSAGGHYTEGKTITRLPDGRWAVYYSYAHNAQERTIGAWVSDTTDLAGTWTNLGGIIPASSSTDQMYSLGVERHEGGYLGLLCGYSKSTERMWMDLWASRDGLAWRKVKDDFIPNGTAGTWDDEMIVGGTTVTRVGDTWHVYYSGSPTNHAAALPRDMRIGRASLTAGRVVVVAGDGGALTTTTFTPAAGVTVNADGTGGSVVVVVLDAAGVPLEGYGATLTTDSTTHTVTVPVGQEVSLRFTLTGTAKLYGYTVS